MCLLSENSFFMVSFKKKFPPSLWNGFSCGDRKVPDWQQWVPSPFLPLCCRAKTGGCQGPAPWGAVHRRRVGCIADPLLPETGWEKGAPGEEWNRKQLIGSYSEYSCRRFQLLCRLHDSGAKKLPLSPGRARPPEAAFLPEWGSGPQRTQAFSHLL